MNFREYLKESSDPKQSAGILLYRTKNGEVEFFLVHPGGPLFTNKQDGYWGFPRGQFEQGENALTAAKREFEEETGMKSNNDLTAIGTVKLKSGKTVHCFLSKGDGKFIKSNNFELEWPPNSGKKGSFPEIDKGDWYNMKDAKIKMSSNQHEFLDRAQKLIKL